MDKDELIDESEILESDQGTSLKRAIQWWEEKRILFNVITGIAGCLPILQFSNHFYLGDIALVFAYGIFMNLLFSIGFLIEALNFHYLKSKLELKALRPLLFWIGTLASAGVTYALSYLFYM